MRKRYVGHGMKTLVIGSNSDIYKAMRPLMDADGFSFFSDHEWPGNEWELCLIPMGRVAPVGHWWELHIDGMEACINSNLFYPLTLLQSAWPSRAKNAKVCFFAGSNPQKIMDGYLPYNMSKMGLIKAVEQLDHETPDATFFAFGPGYYGKSKIHKPTLDAGWPNERIARGDMGNSIEQIWEALRWILSQDKATVGGRNVAVSDYLKHGEALGEYLRADSNRGKLRRVE